MAGPEFGPELEGRILLIDKSLYGLKTSGARFHEHLSLKLAGLGFKPREICEEINPYEPRVPSRA